MSENKKGLNVSTKSFITAIAVILALMVCTYILTLVIPSGSYSRTVDEAGNEIIDTEVGFSYTEGGIPFYKWLLSPILVLGADGSGALIAVIAFLLVIGGIFNALDKCGLIRYMLDSITRRFGNMRYGLMALMTLMFMALGAAIGSFEECVPLVPIVVALAVRLGWDPLVGIGMSMLAAGCGFASGVCNPFTVGVAQELAGLPMFSGIWLRLVSFCLIYALLVVFLTVYAKKIERPISEEEHQMAHTTWDAKMSRGLISFALILGSGILAILCSSFIPFLRDYTMIIVALMFLIAGVVSSLLCGLGVRRLGSTFLRGAVDILPAVAMILMASSIKYTLDEAGVLDTLLHSVIELAGAIPVWTIVLLIYAIVLILNFFIPSGSAKAFMLIPLIVPVAQIFGISAQLCVLAFAFGDGFSNVFYPTNPALLISLGLADTSYPRWFKWSWKFQALNLILTSGILLFGFAVGY